MIKGATEAVIDATLIESAARPKKTITLEVDAEGKGVQFEDGSQPGISCIEEQSVDPDAAWLKKGKKSRLGYRNYLVVDARDGYVMYVGFTAPVNQSEMTHFETAIDCAHIEANRVYADKGSASNANRQFLSVSRLCRGLLVSEVILNKGDMLAVYKLNRLGRSLGDIISLLDDLKAQGVAFQSVTEAIDTKQPPTGRAMWRMLSIMAELERSLIVERTKAGREAAKIRWVVMGRKPKLSKQQIEHAKKLLAGDEHISNIAKSLNVSVRTLYRAIEKTYSM